MAVRWSDKDDITTLAAGDRIPVTDVSDTNVDKYTTPAEIRDYVQGNVVNQTITGYLDLTEMAVPGSPGANVARVYAFDDGGVTKIGIKDAAGAITAIGNGLALPTATAISWASGDVTITHSSNTLTLAGATSGFVVANPITQTPLGGFWPGTGAGANIARFDRVQVGDATDNTGVLDNAGDWLETIRPDTTNNSQLAVLSPFGLIALLGGSRTSDFGTAGSEGCIGVTGWGINNNATQLQTAYGGYFEARRSSGAGTTHGIEIDIANSGAEVSVNAYGNYSYLDGLTSGLWLASGASASPNDASVGMMVVNNTSRFKKGIVFMSTSLEGTDGTGTGSGVAIEFARGQTMQWLSADGGQGAIINSDVSNSGPLQKLLFSDLGIIFRNTNDKNLLRIDANDGYVNGVTITPTATAGAPSIASSGDDTNINLALSAKGSGIITADRQLSISLSSAFAIPLVLTSTDAGANAGPYINLFRNSASPAANDLIGSFLWQAKDSGGNTFNALELFGTLVDATDGSEDTQLTVNTFVAGSAVAAMAIANGVIIGSPTGGFQGSGTLNMDNAIFRDGTQVVGARVTGWTAATNTKSKATFDTTTVTLPQLASRVGQMIDDMIAHGLIGA